MPLTEEDYTCIKYFWETKEDPTAWIGWTIRLPMIKRDHPELIKAMRVFEVSRYNLDSVIRNLKIEENDA